MPYADKNKTIERAAKWNKDHPERVKEIQRKARMKREYNTTPDEYRMMFEKQGGCCAICGARPEKKILSVDHNHETKKVRGLICNPCNIAIGNAKENPIILFNMIKYLELHSD